MVKLAKQFHAHAQVQQNAQKGRQQVMFEMLPLENARTGPTSSGRDGNPTKTPGQRAQASKTVQPLSPSNLQQHLQSQPNLSTLDSFRKQGGGSVAKLKPSQIIQEAKKDLGKGPQFGNKMESNSNTRNRREMHSLASLSSYLQPSHSTNQITPMPDGAAHPQDEVVYTAIRNKFTLNKQTGSNPSRFRNPFDGNASGNPASMKEPGQQLSPRQGKLSQPPASVLSSIDLKEKRIADMGKILDKARMSSNTALGQQKTSQFNHRSNHSTQSQQALHPALAGRATAHQNSVAQLQQYHANLEQFLPQSSNLAASRQQAKISKTLNAYPSQKIISDSAKEDKYKIPYSVSLAASASEKNVVSPLRGKQQRVIQVVQNYQQKHALQSSSPTMQTQPDLINNTQAGRNHHISKTTTGANAGKAPYSIGPDGRQQHQKTRNSSIDDQPTENYISLSTEPRDAYAGVGVDSTYTKKKDKDQQYLDDFAELQAIAAKIKPFPEKTRKMFKHALQELEGEKILDTDSLPMSRPRIRLLLSQMNANEHPDREKRHTNTKDVLLTGLPTKADREAFGKLYSQRREQDAREQKNANMKKLFVEKIEEQRMKNTQRQQRDEYRDALKKTGGYVSASSSDAEGALQAILDPFNSQDKGGEKKRARRNTVEQKQFFDQQLNMLGSSRGSSLLDEMDHIDRGSPASNSPSKSRKERKVEQKKEKAMQELFDLAKIQLDGPQSGDFYNNYQNIQKIIDIEKNEEQEDKRTETQEAGDGKFNLNFRHKNTNSVAKDSFVSAESFQEFTKSPVIEYLKQVHKDHLLPHFLPFKKLAEAEQELGQDLEFGGTSTAGFKYSLDEFHINTRVAPSLARSVRNIHNLQTLSLVNTMLNEESFHTLINSTPKTLQSLDLSQNEHLTPKCYEKLHQFSNLQYLSLCKCNIGDEMIFVLLDTDPHKVNLPIDLNNGNAASPSKKGRYKTPNKKKKKEKEEEETEVLVSGLIKTLKLLNVSKNRVSDTGAQYISTFLKTSKCLETLQVHWNKIRGKGAILISKAVKRSRSLRVLDVSFNSFASGAIRKVQVKDGDDQDGIIPERRHVLQQLQCVESAWKWRSALRRNRFLIHFDISYNQFSIEDMQVVGDGLRENHTLLGFHTEGNNAAVDSLGFVIPAINSRGERFINMKQKQKDVFNVHSYNQIPVNLTKDREATADLKPELKADETLFDDKDSESTTHDVGKVVSRNCWLCEGWVQLRFEVRLPEKYAGQDVKAVFIHFAFEDYKPMVMLLKETPFDDGEEEESAARIAEQQQIAEAAGSTFLQKVASNTGGKQIEVLEMEPRKTSGASNVPRRQTVIKTQAFYLFRMVPPNKDGHKYFYSLQNPKNFRKETFIDQTKQRMFVEEDPTLTRRLDTDTSDEDIEANLPFPKFVNVTDPIYQQRMPLDGKRRIFLQAKPRQIFTAAEGIRPASPWSLAKSFFAKYKADNEMILNKCFDFDWNCSSLNRMVKDPDNNAKVKAFLRSKYMLIRETYKHLSCVAPSGNIASLSMNVMTELMLKCNDLVDYKTIKLSDVDLAFIATNASGNKNFPYRAEECLNPERQLIRYQFLEILVRLGFERFVAKGPKTTQPNAIAMFVETYLEEPFTKYDSHTWRLERYWNEECDKVIKENMQVLQDIYAQFAAPINPGDPKVLRLNRLIDLITASGVCDDNFGAREIGVIYNLSMMTQVDEIHNTRHMDMRFIEYVEALARVADKAITRKTQEFVGRDPSTSGVQGAMEGTPAPSSKAFASSRKKVGRDGGVASIGDASRSKSTPRERSNLASKKLSKAPSFGDVNKSRDNLSAASFTHDETIGGDLNKHHGSAEILDELPRFGDLDHIAEENQMRKSQMSFTGPLKADDSLIQLKPVGDNQLQASPRPVEAQYHTGTTPKAVKKTEEGDPGRATETTPKKPGAGAARLNMLMEDGMAMKLITNLSMPTKPKQPKKTTRQHSRAISRSQMSNGSSGTPSKTSAGRSQMEEPLLLHEKLQKYIRRIAATAMPTVYAHKYLREQAKKAVRAAQDAQNALDDDGFDEDDGAVIGFNATLERICYGPKPANRTPPPERTSPRKQRGTGRR